MRKNIDKLIKKYKNILLCGHVSPDGDCIGSTLGLYNYIVENYKDKKVTIFLENMVESYKFLKGWENILFSYKEDDYDLGISLDCADKDRIGVVGENFFKIENTIVIDHHATNKGYGKINIINSKSVSTSEVLYDLLNEKKISKNVAECIYLGLIQDSGVFKYEATSSKTMNIAGKLMDKGVDFTSIIEDTFHTKSYKENKFLGIALLNSRMYFSGKVIATIVTKNNMDRLNITMRQSEGVAAHMRSTRGVELAILLYEKKENEFKLSLRSEKYVDCTKITEIFGGGGHIRAAGATVKGGGKEILKKVLIEAKNRLKQDKNEGNISNL